MNEERKSTERNEPIEGAKIKLKSPFFKWLDNFFYHYKWHTLVALFLVFTVVVCSLQMCAKTSFDLHIMYAGGGEISQRAAENDLSDYQKFTSSVKSFTDDFDGDGAKNINLQVLYIPTEEEIREIENDPRREVNYTLISSNTETFSQNIYFGEYYICLLSENLFANWSKKDVQIFAAIDGYTNGNSEDYVYASEYGVYLSSTELYKLPGFSQLPEDTVICIRVFGDFTDNDDKAVYNNSEKTLRAMLSRG